MPNKHERAAGIFEFGVFEWRGDGKYTRDQAKRTFKTRIRAERWAATRNMVVRGLDASGKHRLPPDTRSAFERSKREERF